MSQVIGLASFGQVLICHWLFWGRLVGVAGETVSTAQECFAQCAGLSTFVGHINKVRKEGDLDYATSCLEFQGNHTINSCVLESPQACAYYTTNFTRTKNECLRIGIDITKEPFVAKYPRTTCRMCVFSKGASGKKAYYNIATAGDCEKKCHEDEACRVIDYDGTRELCRTWANCPLSSQSDEYGCGWTIYTKPGYETEEDASGVNLKQGPDSGASTTYAGPGGPHALGLISAATSAWQALYTITFVAPLLVASSQSAASQN